jgi:hypothetical protein
MRASPFPVPSVRGFRDFPVNTRNNTGDTKLQLGMDGAPRCNPEPIPEIFLFGMPRLLEKEPQGPSLEDAIWARVVVLNARPSDF